MLFRILVPDRGARNRAHNPLHLYADGNCLLSEVGPDSSLLTAPNTHAGNMQQSSLPADSLPAPLPPPADTRLSKAEQLAKDLGLVEALLSQTETAYTMYGWTALAIMLR